MAKSSTGTEKSLLYRVIRVTPTVVRQPDGPPVDGQRVDFFVTGSGDHSVTIPDSQFDPVEVDRLVGDWAAKIAAVLSIEGPEVALDEYGRPMPMNPGA